MTPDDIRAMSQEELARLHRFAPIGHEVFDTSKPLLATFEKCFKGMTPALSKKIGWEQ